MPNLLIDESPQTYKPTLAAWIGLNEAIFLQQLHYVLTKQDNVGKFADGRKWYRDKPKDFVTNYFPFWDESIVKRTIANLRADALILVRSDLNKDPKDRSLWYTVHYQAVERLSGPVERILNKSEKRKEARKSRKSKDSDYPDYTKVQNVLNAKVQIVEPIDESTKRTIGKVQNVPTPKESLPKDSITSPYGEGGKPPPPIDKPLPEVQPEPETPPPRVEYTPFLRKFLAYFNAKRFRNPTQTQTVFDLVTQYGETELEALAVWAANKGMGLGQAVPAIKSALSKKGHNQNGHFTGKSTAYGTEGAQPARKGSEGPAISPERAAKLARLSR